MKKIRYLFFFGLGKCTSIAVEILFPIILSQSYIFFLGIYSSVAAYSRLIGLGFQHVILKDSMNFEAGQKAHSPIYAVSIIYFSILCGFFLLMAVVFFLSDYQMATTVSLTFLASALLCMTASVASLARIRSRHNLAILISGVFWYAIFIIAVLFFYSHNWEIGSTGYLIIMIASIALPCIVLVARCGKFLRNKNCNPTTVFISSAKLGAAIGICGFAYSTMSRIDIIANSWMKGDANVAQVLASRIGVQLLLINQIIFPLIAPKIASHISMGNFNEARKLLENYEIKSIKYCIALGAVILSTILVAHYLDFGPKVDFKILSIYLLYSIAAAPIAGYTHALLFLGKKFTMICISVLCLLLVVAFTYTVVCLEGYSFSTLSCIGCCGSVLGSFCERVFARKVLRQ